jgi:hypothetical protein
MLAWAQAAGAQTPTGSIVGRVIDQGSQQPIPDVVVRVDGLAVQVVTDGDGMFLLLSVPIGERSLTIQHLSYGQHTRTVLVEPGEDLRLEARISQRAIELAPLVVEALNPLERRRVTSGFGVNEVVRDEIAEAARTGQSLSELLRDRLPGALMRGGTRGSACLEVRGARRGGRCNEVMVMLDGVQISNPGFLYTTMPLEQIERLELVSAGEAGARYGSAGGFGVLLIETRQGPRPSRAGLEEERRLSGFDWSQEAEPYRWGRVWISSFLANAIGLGLSVAVARECFWVPETGSLGLRTRCGGAATVAVGALSMGLPTLGGSLAARWGGSTERSQGRVTASALSGALALTSGYLLMLHGSPVTETVGGALLALGVPTLITLSDRVFRVLR